MLVIKSGHLRDLDLFDDAFPSLCKAESRPVKLRPDHLSLKDNDVVNDKPVRYEPERTSETILLMELSSRILFIISLAAVWWIERGVSAAVIRGHTTACGNVREMASKKVSSEARSVSSLAPSRAMS